MTRSAATSRPLPAEADDPRNQILDMIEANLAAGLAADLGPQLEARICRLFPDLVRRPADPDPDPVPAPESDEPAAAAVSRAAAVARYADIDRAVRLSNALHFVLASRAAGAEAHAETIRAEIERLKSTGYATP